MLSDILKNKSVEVHLTMLEVGAVPIAGSPDEPFHKLLKAFPDSRIIAFEIDENECQRLNQTAPAGIHFYAQALGRSEETRDFYVAAAPMCSSLYPPNQPFCDLFHNLGSLVRTTKKIQINTVSLDHFAREAGIDCIDFIKIDVQGAELEIFRGGERTLDSVMTIVTEVEFEPIYVGQPLYEDVSAYLRPKGFALHKFLGMAGRAIQPIIYNNNANLPQQHLWTDAVFIRDLSRIDGLSDDAILKLALLMECYGSYDVCHYALTRLDERRKSDLGAVYLQSLLRRCS
jgi:FkbM family methyltransferase